MIKKVKKGFTLIELVVVIAVIAILSAVSVVAYVGITNSAKKSAAQQEADQIAMTIRAASLTSADGYVERYVGDGAPAATPVATDDTQEKTHANYPRYRVTWTQDGLVFENLKENANLEIEAILADMYGELEGKGLSSDIELKVADSLETSFKASPWKSSAVPAFSYKNASAEVEAKFAK